MRLVTQSSLPSQRTSIGISMLVALALFVATLTAVTHEFHQELASSPHDCQVCFFSAHNNAAPTPFIVSLPLNFAPSSIAAESSESSAYVLEYNTQQPRAPPFHS